MPTLPDYHHFEGRHWETGSVCNAFAYQGVTAPHTRQPYSEAMLLGISGGIVMGYFSFAYSGYDPHVALLTRNTFDPLDRLLQRMGVGQDVRQTANPERAVRNLVEALEDGRPALAWADVYSLPYNALYDDPGMWLMYPVVVYGYEPAQDRALIADRAAVPLAVTTGELAAARGRVKLDKHRVVTLSPPDPDKLAAAVQQGLWDCIRLFTEAPPKGGKDNFGFAAFQRWADLLAKPRQKQSWERVFPPGRKMYAGLASTYRSITQLSPDGSAERSRYADFLEEAAVLLNRPGLRDAAGHFRESGQAWRELAYALLPDGTPPFAETRRLMSRRQKLFLEDGGAALPEMLAINERLNALRKEMESGFPLDAAGVQTMLENLRDHILRIDALERQAVGAMQAALAGAG